MARYPTRRTVSAGGVVLEDRAGEPWVLVIARRDQSGALQWSLPKGRLEEGEGLAEAALREVREETGLACRIIAELGVIDYWFLWREEGVRYHKFVHYFLMEPAGGNLDARDDEADDIAWLPLPRALERLSHANERALVRTAVSAERHGT